MKLKRKFFHILSGITLLVAVTACQSIQIFPTQTQKPAITEDNSPIVNQSEEVPPLITNTTITKDEQKVEVAEENQLLPLPAATMAPLMAYMPAPSIGVPPPLTPPNGDPYWDNFFKNYGVNPMIDTEDDHLSTFALDVDTGSYTLIRRFLRDGNLPDKDAVRVEEVVNYFNQEYAYPREGQAFAISLDGGAAPFTESEKYQMLRVGIQGYAVSPEERKDVSLVFVIDVSGSMDMENRLELVKNSLDLLVDELRPTDTVGIVVYGTEARIVLEPTSGKEKNKITSAIHSLHPEGVTNAEAGLRLGYKLATEAFNAEGINRVILCSDGVANFGETDQAEIWENVESKAEKGITLTTVGFGMGNYNDVLMEQLADKGDGFYAYVDTIIEAKRIFVNNLTSTLQVIAKDAKVQVDFNPEVVARYRLVGFENRNVADEDFRNDKVDAGEIGAGHSVTALYEIKLQTDAKGTVAKVYLRWEDPDSQKVTELNKEYSTEELHTSFEDANPRFQWDVVVAEFADVLRESYWAQKTTLKDVLKSAEVVASLLPKDKDVQECVELIRDASKLKGK